MVHMAFRTLNAPAVPGSQVNSAESRMLGCLGLGCAVFKKGLLGLDFGDDQSLGWGFEQIQQVRSLGILNQGECEQILLCLDCRDVQGLRWGFKS